MSLTLSCGQGQGIQIRKKDDYQTKHMVTNKIVIKTGSTQPDLNLTHRLRGLNTGNSREMLNKTCFECQIQNTSKGLGFRQ